MGLHRRLLATCIGIGCFGTWPKGASDRRRSQISKVEKAIRTFGCSLPSWLSVLWTSGDRKDLLGIGIGGGLRVVGLRNQSCGVQRSQPDERRQSGDSKFRSVV